MCGIVHCTNNQPHHTFCKGWVPPRTPKTIHTYQQTLSANTNHLQQGVFPSPSVNQRPGCGRERKSSGKHWVKQIRSACGRARCCRGWSSGSGRKTEHPSSTHFPAGIKMPHGAEASPRHPNGTQVFFSMVSIFRGQTTQNHNHVHNVVAPPPMSLARASHSPTPIN